MTEVAESTGESAQQATLHFVIPVLAVLLTCGAPFLLIQSLRSASSTFKDELRNTLRRPLSLISVAVLFLSPTFLLSNYTQSGLARYGVYCIVLALANIVVDRLGRRSAWPLLLLWHFFNLLNLVGGASSILQPYSTGNGGIIQEAFRISGTAGAACPTADYLQVDWCSDGWITVQIIVAFLFVAIHLAAFLLLAARTIHFFGGEDDGPGCGRTLGILEPDAAPSASA
eukprot:TRINITY_DN32376_c0_g1_i1.p1 TRINITY_DN32376_c0_g1~~TRINITY_DN32376_c0_g1_i1.p1  ORF type:complete len:228 (-),score=23.97 TRINITY_DN32376_c0_g1_i1:424-1107(-)